MGEHWTRRDWKGRRGGLRLQLRAKEEKDSGRTEKTGREMVWDIIQGKKTPRRKYGTARREVYVWTYSSFNYHRGKKRAVIGRTKLWEE